MTHSLSLEERVAELERKVASLERQSATTLDVVVHQTESPSPARSAQIEVGLKKKTFHKADYLSGDAGDRIDFELQFTNRLVKAIRAFKGTLIFRDLFDELVLSVELKHEDTVRVGGAVVWRGGFVFNQFEPGHQRLLSCDVDDLRTTFETQIVVYEDGSSERF